MMAEEVAVMMQAIMTDTIVHMTCITLAVVTPAAGVVEVRII